VATEEGAGDPHTDEAPGTPQGEIALQAIAMPRDANVNGDIFGGWLMSHMDLASAVIFRQRTRGRGALVACDAMQFHSPVFVGDLVSFHGRIVREGRTSLVIGIEAWVRRMAYGEHLKVTEGTFTFVALDDDRKPRPLPPIS